MKTSHFEERTALRAVQTAQRRDESTQREIATFGNDLGSAWLVPPAEEVQRTGDRRGRELRLAARPRLVLLRCLRIMERTRFSSEIGHFEHMVTKPKFLLCFALVLSGCLFGCSTTKPAFATGDMDTEQIKLPIKFADYREFFTFLGTNSSNGMPINDETLFKLAAESTIKIVQLDYKEMPYVYIVETHYLRGIYDDLRSAQNNGQYYILRPLAANNAALGGFELVGILDGAAYTVQNININEMPRFVSFWHLSAGEHPETIYEWNGKIFEQKK